MTTAADLVALMAEAGTPPELLAAVAQRLFAGETAQEAIDARRANDRDRKARKSREVTGTDVTDAEITNSPFPLTPPLKVSPDPFKITPPISPIPTTESRGCRLRDDWKPEPLNGKALTMVERWQPGEVEREIAKFRNYWMARAGKDACRTNWQRTFINWLISADERKPRYDQRQQHSSRTSEAVYAVIGDDPHAPF